MTSTEPAAANASANASTWARLALKQLAAQRLAPTPDNFARAYFEIAPDSRAESSVAAADMLRELAGEWPRADSDARGPGAELKSAVDARDWERVKRSLAQLAPKAGADGDAEAWAGVVRKLAEGLAQPSQAAAGSRRRDKLERLLARASGDGQLLRERLDELAIGWQSGAGSEPAAAHDAAPQARLRHADEPAPGESDAELAPLLRELLVRSLKHGPAEPLGGCPELVGEARQIARRVQQASSKQGLDEITESLEHLWAATQAHTEDQHEIQQSLQRLLHLLIASATDLVGEDRWLKEQFEALESLIGSPLQRDRLTGAERSLRELVYRQGTLRRDLDQAKSALKDMLVGFVGTLGTLSANAGDHRRRIDRHVLALQSTNDVNELSSKLSSILGEAVQDMRGMQENIARSHEELTRAQRKADEYESKVHELKQALDAASTLVHEDELTSTLNRRGLDAAYQQEVWRCERRGAPLSVGMLDVDNFKQLNDTLGHGVGDQALVHLVQAIRRTVRPTDLVARYGGEEFVLVFPESIAAAAADIMARMQRELTRHFFLHDNNRVLITFSAGVAQRAPGESQEELIERADRALYRAKQAGRNRVYLADPPDVAARRAEAVAAESTPEEIGA